MTLAYRISKYNRDRKWQIFLREIAPTRRTTVLDIGFSDEEYSVVDNYIEKHYPYLDMLTALGIDVPVKFKERYPAVDVVHYGGDVFPFADKAFDVAWSNAVLEHVGDRAMQLEYLREIKRVARRAFVTTPNRHFPIEVHTRTPLLHYLPKELFDKYLRVIGKEWATGSYMYLLSYNELIELLAKAKITDYKVFVNRFGGIAMDYAVVF